MPSLLLNRILHERQFPLHPDLRIRLQLHLILHIQGPSFDGRDAGALGLVRDGRAARAAEHALDCVARVGLAGVGLERAGDLD